jgi:alpha-tubulin suppressor-like RCC1 family protein
MSDRGLELTLLLALAACSLPGEARESFVQLSAGAFHTCGVTASGGVKCWGANYDGQIGDGTKTERLLPVEVLGFAGGAKAVSAGGRSTCALTNQGKVICWGHSDYGQLGIGTQTNLAVRAEVRLPGEAVAIDVGGAHACALTRDGRVLCWGYLYSKHECRYDLFTGTTCSPYVHQLSLDPTEVHELRGARQIRASPTTGFYLPHFGPSVCAILQDGSVRCAERFDQGTRVVPGLESNVVSLAVGISHACAVTSTGAVKCSVWPMSDVLHMSTAQVTEGLEKDAVSIAAGWDMSNPGAVGGTCAVTVQARVKCWGDGGALGDGTWTSRGSAVEVAALRGAVSVTGGSGRACALLGDGQAYCWGKISGDSFFSPSPRVQNLTPIGVSGFSEGVIAQSPGPLTGLWWNPAESGWGLTIVDRRETSFVALYAYDGIGRPKWYFASNCVFGKSRSEIGAQCTGSLYEAQGPHFPAEPFDARSVQLLEAGQFRLNLSGRESGTATITIGGAIRIVNVERFVFRSDAPLDVNYSDLWWNPNESGWGLTVAHQADVMFLAWYVYDGAGKPVWYVASNCAVSGHGCTGTLYRTTGPPFGPTFDPAKVQVITAGTASLAFSDANNGTLTYTVNGVSASKAVTRLLF